MKSISINSTLNAGENLGISSLPARSHCATSARSPHVPAKRSQCQDTTKVSIQQLQEAIAEQRLTDCLEQIESLGFLGEEAQLSCLNLAHQLHRGCRV
ncbi:hypothetical protein H6F61_24095 [Cyanobacteria bacterium FACHB-472]|nr:hypothetical protein [Cyanobacteria bacterium FACHB-472]